ncbi:hypothetical protein Tco_0510311, partial [Tanacetum coccineum]
AWPSLNEVNRKDKGQNVVGNRIRDADTMQGMSFNGNNKLSKIPVRVNGKGNKVVDMDPLLEEGSKRAYGRASFARVLIEVDATQE